MCSTGPPGCACATRNGTGVHGPPRSISAKKPGRSGRVIEAPGAAFRDDAVAADVDIGLEIFLGADRGKAIALDGESQHGDPRVVLGQRLLLQWWSERKSSTSRLNVAACSKYGEWPESGIRCRWAAVLRRSRRRGTMEKQRLGRRRAAASARETPSVRRACGSLCGANRRAASPCRALPPSRRSTVVRDSSRRPLCFGG